MMPILEAKNIVKRFGKHEVLKGVSLAIHQKRLLSSWDLQVAVRLRYLGR